MLQKHLNQNFNLEDLHINDSFYQKNNNPIQDCNIFPISKINTLSQNEYNIEEGSIINDNIFLSKLYTLSPVINAIDSNDKPTKINTNEEEGINNIFKQNKYNIIKNDNIKQINESESKKYIYTKSNLNQKRKNENTTKRHNKYSDDNLRRRTKNLVLTYALQFINDKIRILYKGNIGNGINKKELIPISRIYKVNTSIEDNKNFIYKTLGEIFSGDISSRFKTNFPEYNKNLIKRLLNDKDENKREYFQRLFNIQFLKCIDVFSGSYDCEELKGFTKFNDIKNSYNHEYEPEYIEKLEFYLKNYEKIIKSKKRGKQSLKNQKKEEDTI